MQPRRRPRPVTRLGCWLRGPWPLAEGNAGADAVPVAVADPPNAAEGASALERVAALAVLAEMSGFDSLWVTDRVPTAGVGSSGHADPEAYSLLGALAARTQHVRLGVIPLDADRRSPSLVAKIVTGIDVISHGRAVLTYGLGPSDTVRGARVIEALRVGHALLEDESPTFAGTFYSVVDAMNRPGPVQDGGVPVVVFIEGHPALATVAMTEFAGLADAVIVGGGPDEVRLVIDGVASVSDGSLPQVIGIGPAPGDLSPSNPRRQPNNAGSAAPIVDGVRDLFGAGVDGCIVPVDLSTSPEVLAAIGAGLGDVSVHPVQRRGRPDGGT